MATIDQRGAFAGVRGQLQVPWGRIDMELKTIAFVDCCGYSAYTDEHGDAAGVEVYLGMRRAIECAAAGAGVVIVKWTGDGAMLAADSSTAALTCIYRAMIAMRESGPLALRAGATVGPVTRVPYGELDYLGSAVNRAARLCADAAPWQVRVGLDAGHAAMYFTLRPADVAPATSRDFASTSAG